MGAPARHRIRFGDGDVLQFRIELDEILPVVWRRVAVSGRASLQELHGVIQRAMGRSADGAYAFDVDGVRYHDPIDDPQPGHETDETSLEMLELHPGAVAFHIAEHHGEPWHDRVILELVTPRMVGQRLPTCLAAGRAAPPDDCDGPADYREMLAALAEPFDPRLAELRSWLPEEFDPAYVDLVAINASLARTPKHRPA
ncbi:MAG: plasmid pRiA4b ORF-3 family protein [Gemmatimonadales bacterium]